MWRQDSRTEIYQHLWQEITDLSFLPFFKHLKRNSTHLASFATPGDLVLFIQNPTVGNPVTPDQVVCILIRRYHVSKSPAHRASILSLLLLGLWPRLEETYVTRARRLRFLPDPFSEVYAGYLCSIGNLKRPKRVGIISLLQDKAEQFIRQTIRDEIRFRRLPERLEKRGYKPPTPTDYSKAEAMVSDWIAQGVITEPEKELIWKHIINEQSFVWLGQEMGVSPDTLSKRYRRAIKRLRKFLEDKVRWNCKGRCYRIVDNY